MTETATFALGCFWGPDEFFSELPGVSETVVGYASGTTIHPTYDDLGDHTECVQITFDPQRIAYEGFLEHFWREHDPTLMHKVQYQSMILTHSDEQQCLAEASRDERQKKLGQPIVTVITPLTAFHRAEEYHQKYLRKNRGAVC